MDNIDYNQYDVSIYMNTPKSNETLNNINKVHKKARFLFRDHLAVNSLYEVYRDKFVHNRGAHSNFTKKLYPETAYRREFKRIFGRANFDYAIDFSGYSLYWAKYLLASNAKKKICYMHNDLLSDSERTINGRKPHRTNLRGLFSVYNKFDKLVSVSSGTMELNKNNLTEFAEEFRFDYAMNSINPEKILKLGSKDFTEHIRGIEKVGIQEPSQHNLNFVTMGRLSPEKGQDNLIQAFARFHQEFTNSKLYIIGEGPIRKNLEKLIAELQLNESVFLVGQLENPFPLMKKCDCFVLSSHYEGQPMVLLEAMTHGMKIIATDIVANRTVLENGRYGSLVENSINGIRDGLNQLARNELNNKLDEFIPEEYNKKAMETFYQVLDKGNILH
jgi:glycosyltransferase involved in cell wall biosynthesis